MNLVILVLTWIFWYKLLPSLIPSWFDCSMPLEYPKCERSPLSGISFTEMCESRFQLALQCCERWRYEARDLFSTRNARCGLSSVVQGVSLP